MATIISLFFQKKDTSATPEINPETLLTLPGFKDFFSLI